MFHNINKFLFFNVLGKTNLKLAQPQHLAALLQQIFHGYDKCTDFNIPNNWPNEWPQKLWSYLQKYFTSNLALFENLPILPCNESLLIKLVTNNPVLLANFQFLSAKLQLPEDIQSIVKKLGVTLIPSLPDYVKNHQHVLDNYVMLPDVGGVLNSLVSVAQQKFPSNTWHNWQKHVFEKLTTVEKRTFRKFISSVKNAQSKSNFKNFWHNFCSHLQLFELETEKFTSVAMCKKMTSEEKIVALPLLTNLLDSSDASAVTLARWLGVQPMSAEKVLVKVIFKNVSNKSYNKSQLEALIEAIIPSYLNKTYKNNTISEYLCSLKFIPTNMGNVKSPSELYDSSDYLLCKLFEGQDIFPSDSVQHHLHYLLELGIKTRTNVSDVELLSVAKDIHQRPSIAKSEALLHFIKETISPATRMELSQLNWLAVICERPKNYPVSLPWAGEHSSFSSPNEVVHEAYVDICGSVCIFPRNHPNIKCIFDILNGHEEPDIQSYVNHLRHIVENYNSIEKPKYFPIVFNLYEKLQSKLAGEFLFYANQCIKQWVWHGDGFCEPSRCFIDKTVRDMSPHAFCLPEELKRFLEFFELCGVRNKVDKMELLSWIAEWYAKDNNAEIPAEQLHRDTELVIKILNEVRDDIQNNKLKLNEVSNQVFIPVETEGQSLKLVKPADCTYYDGEWQKLQKVCVEYEDLQIIHHDIPIATAQCLGIPSLTSRLISAEELEFESYGQSEPLTTRIKNLIKDYSDGLSVLKEFVQNADDAGATEICFLIDERENLDARTLLLDNKFSPCQGPAIVVYNNATFSDDDFRNIVKIGEATKENNAQKIGKFGLGFNSVYNITDVPCFLSRNFLAIFDPQMKYINNASMKKSNPGVKILLDNLIKHSAVYGDQIKPFQSVFGCNINENNNQYPGTLFRLPLRTPDEARESEICQQHYSQDDVLRLFKLLFDNGQNILMFTQNVKKIELYHLKKSDENPIQMKLLYKVKKTGLNNLTFKLAACCHEDFQFLKQATEAIKKQANDFPSQGLNISLLIELSSCITCDGNILLIGKNEEVKTTTNWLISQSIGKSDSLKISKKDVKLLPVAGVAVKLIKCGEGYQPTCLIPKSDESGLLFCFLPLPIYTCLPLHVNGCFALSSSRRHLMAVNDKDKEDPRAQWNHALFVDAVIEAYINAVVDLRLIVKNNVNDIFSLWPIPEQDNRQFISLMTDKFYERVVLSDIQLFPHPSGWKSFQECEILEVNFRFSPAGELAQKVLLQLSERNYCGAVIELPKAQWFRLQALVQQKFEKKLISPICFFEQYFFPHIGYLDRLLVDCLLIYALFTKTYELSECLKRYACIPVKPFGKFKHIYDLIHPLGSVAPLFKEEEECFPVWSESNTTELCKFYQDIFEQFAPNFKFFQLIYDALAELGMQADDIPVDQLAEKAAAVTSHLHNLKSYCNTILQVLEKKIKEKSISNDKISYFKTISFLPVKLKPEKCSFQWFSDSTKPLLNASSLYLEESSSLICCIAPVVDESQVSVSKTIRESLEFREKSSINLDFILQQVKIINASLAANDKQSSVADYLRKTCHDIYMHLSENREPEIEHKLLYYFNNVPFILLGAKLIQPSLCSYNLKFLCDPYLYGLSAELDYTTTFKNLMTSVGVKESFNSSKYNLCLQHMHEEFGCRKLCDNDLQKAINVSLELVNALDKEGKHVEQLQEECGSVYLPDSYGILQRSTILVHNETPWLEEKQFGVNFINGKLGYDILKRLGGKTLRENILGQNMLPFARPFGQKEKLTTRLKKIISDYPNDESVLRELLQNADDAGCSEIHFILDPRNHKSEKVFSEEWKQLQGPSLLVLNDKGFSNEDLEGIQNLGEGSKGNDCLKTGRYGVGFNCVYHLTDCPSLLTSTPSTGPVLCIFDPHNKFIPNATLDNPGCLLTDIEQMKLNFPDAFSCFADKLPSKQGTVFRFPLRTEYLAETSLLSNEAITVDHIKSLFEKFKTDAHDCLLFLRNVMSIKISTVNESKSVLETFYIQSTLLEEDLLKRQKFNDNIIQYSKQVKQDTMNLLSEFTDNIVSYKLAIIDSNNESSNWLITQQFGLSQTKTVREEIVSAIKKKDIGMLLQGGVALKISSDIMKILANDNKKLQSVNTSASIIDDKMKIYCFLPLPLLSHLPVHINGFFALDHEARRGLFRDGENSPCSYRSLWNLLLIEQVIAPAYVELLAQIKNKLVLNNIANTSRRKIRISLLIYLALFPTVDEGDVYIKTLAKAVYKRMADGKYQLFPTLRASGNSTVINVSWLSPVSNTIELKPVYDSCHSNMVVRDILLDCGMYIVELSGRVYSTCQQALEEMSKEFCKLSPLIIKEFFMTSGMYFCQSIMPALPKPLIITPLKKVENVLKILTYYVGDSKTFPDLSGLQLLVTVDGILRCYSPHNPVFVTPKFDLIPVRKDLFVNKDILRYFLGKEWKQASLRVFYLNDFIKYLPEHLSQDEWCGSLKRVLLEEETDEIIKWVIKVWNFIGECFATNEYVTKDNILLHLLALHEWCLFPALEHGRKVLYPVGKAKSIIDLAHGDSTSQMLRDALGELSIPTPDCSIFQKLDCAIGPSICWAEETGEKVLRMLSGNVSDCGSIISALGSLMEKECSLATLNSSQCDTLLDYFSENLSRVRTIGDSIQILQRLPCYQTIFADRSDLHFKYVYIIPEGIPLLTKQNFSVPIEIIFLFKNLKLHNLYLYLGCKELSLTEFYCQYLLCLLEATGDSEERYEHLSFIRDKYQLLSSEEREALQNFFQTVSTKLFPNLINELKPASQLMDPFNSVLRLFHKDAVNFPHSPYDGPKWHDFLVMCGLIHDIHPNGLLAFARELSLSDLQDMNSIAEKAKALLKYIFDEYDEFEV